MSSPKPYVSRLLIYPIKSLDWLECDRVNILKSGAIKGDRTWGIFDEQNRLVNGKNNVQIHSLRSQFDFKANILTLKVEGRDSLETFSLDRMGDLSHWLQEYFGFPIIIRQNLDRGFPDDLVSPGATIISTATLETVASWYPELDTEDIRRRFRANIEIAGVPAFWEDKLFTTADKTVKFQVGGVEFRGVNPCQRCVVVTRNPRTGEPYPQFQKIFVQQRKSTLPKWSEQSRFNHFFRLAVNTKLSPTEAGKSITVGDRVFLKS